jgi:membrane protease YdiL (CAAX protease family)
MLSEKPWKLDGILCLTAGVLLCLASVAFTDKGKLDEDSLLYLVLTTLSLHGPILLGTWIFLRVSGMSWQQAFGFLNPPVSRAILLGAIGAIAFLPVGMVLQDVSIRVLTWLHFSTPPQVAVEAFDKTATWINRAYLVFFAVVIAPFVEEIFFRGALYAVVKKAGFPRFAMWFSAFWFALIHANASIFVPLLVLGLMLAWLYEKTNNLLASITAHSMFNAINVVLLLGDDLRKMISKFMHSSP